MGKLIVMEGIDGSGKGTQFHLLCEALSRDGCAFQTLDFPRYGNPSCAMVEKYLHGEFGARPGDVNAYMASTFFAVDRAASWLEDWGRYYTEGGLVIANRYTTSNVIHQGSKLPPEEREAYFRWLYNYEFGLLGLPKPDCVFYMDIPTETAEAQRALRQQQTGTEADIHERDSDYLRACRDCGETAVRLLGWRSVQCVRDGKMRTREDIHGEIYRTVKSLLESEK